MYTFCIAVPLGTRRPAKSTWTQPHVHSGNRSGPTRPTNLRPDPSAKCPTSSVGSRYQMSSHRVVPSTSKSNNHRLDRPRLLVGTACMTARPECMLWNSRKLSNPSSRYMMPRSRQHARIHRIPRQAGKPRISRSTLLRLHCILFPSCTSFGRADRCRIACIHSFCNRVKIRRHTECRNCFRS